MTLANSRMMTCTTSPKGAFSNLRPAAPPANGVLALGSAMTLSSPRIICTPWAKGAGALSARTEAAGCTLAAGAAAAPAGAGVTEITTSPVNGCACGAEVAGVAPGAGLLAPPPVVKGFATGVCARRGWSIRATDRATRVGAIFMTYVFPKGQLLWQARAQGFAPLAPLFEFGAGVCGQVGGCTRRCKYAG